MRLASLRNGDGTEAALLHEDHLIPARTLLDRADTPPPKPPSGRIRITDLLIDWDTTKPLLEDALATFEAPKTADIGQPRADASLAAPIPHPPSFRDFYAFEEHVARSWERRGEPIPDAWYQQPVFYFSNPAAILGPNDPVHRPAASNALDFELELGWVISRQATNLTPETAEDAILGLTILNDWSARDLQRQEMSVGLGPSKGKDFATSIGPLLVTLDELEPHRDGNAFDLTMTARINGEPVSEGNLAQIHYSLGEMTAHASQDTRLVPGDLMGTGTVGTGSILDLGTEDWLEPGDRVELEIEELGVLTSRVAGANTR